MVLRVERALYIHSPHLQSLPDRDLKSQDLDYESDSLTIRPRLLIYIYIYFLYTAQGHTHKDKSVEMLNELRFN